MGSFARRLLYTLASSLVAHARRALKLNLAIEMILNDAFVRSITTNEIFGTGLVGLIDYVVDEPPIDNRQHLSRQGFGSGEK